MASTQPELSAPEQQPPAVIAETASTESTVSQEQQQMEAPQKETTGQESQLHMLCAEGDVMGVRGILSSSLEYLESIDPKTGLTPMLAAIYASQTDVVRELLSAGAYPPPPTVTQDPSILALIYPPSAAAGGAAPYGMPQMPFPPTGQGEQQMGYYGPPFVPGGVPVMGQQEGQYGAPPQMFVPPVGGAGRMRREGKEGGVLPPAEQAKQILCRNFPNCRYGAACHFFHPTTAPFYAPPGQHGQPFMPYDPRFTAPQGPRHDGFYGMQGAPPPFVPQQQQVQAETANGNAFISAAAPSFVPPPPQAQAQSNEEAAQHIPSVNSPPFVPGAGAELKEAQDNTAAIDSSAKPTDIQPNGTHLSAPAAPFAPRNGQPQPFFNGNANVFDRKPHHIKKASMNGGRVGPSARQMLLGTWNQGQPPACVFFLANKCRNGDMCKFPHILPDGTDCRHPDVINGTIPSAPISAGGPRGPKPRNGMVNGGFYGANNPQQVHAMQRMQAMQAAKTNTAPAQANGSKQPEEKKETASGSTSLESSTADVSSPDLDPSATEQSSAPARATSRPGTTRSVPNTRAHSPTHSTASYGGPRAGRFSGRGAASQTANGAASRSTSIPAAVTKQPKQRVPGAEEFPALSGSIGSLAGDSAKPAAVNSNTKTAAQILSEPAVPRPTPQAAKPVAVAAETKPASEEPLVRTLSGSSSVRGVSTQSDDDAVVISQLPVDSTPSKPVTRPEGVKSGISFASIASSARESVSAAIDAATTPSMVSLQA